MNSYRRLHSIFPLSTSIARCLSLSALVLGLASTAHSAAFTWNGPDGGDWDDSGNWVPSGPPVAADTALFNTALTSVTNAVTDGALTSVSFDTSAGTTFGGFSIGATSGYKLTLSNSGTIQILSTLTDTGKAISINAPLVLNPASATTAGAYTFTNGSASATNTLNLGGAISGGTTTNTVTLTVGGANTGINTVTGKISNGSAASLALVKTGAGTWLLSGNNTFTGGVTSPTTNGGTLYINHNNALGTGAVTWANGSAGNTSGAPITFANNINLNQNAFTWTTGIGETTGVFSINHASAQIKVTGGMLTLRKLDADISGRAVTLQTGGGTIQIKEAAGANVTGAVSIGSSSAITVIVGHQNALGTGTMSWLSGASTFQASTDLTGANAIANTLEFKSASGGSGYTFSGNSSIEFTGTATVNHTNDNQMILNNIAAGKTLKFKDFVLNNAATASMTTVFSGSGATEVAGIISNGGGTTRGLTYSGTGSLTLSGSNSYNGLTTLTGRTLTLTGSNSSAGTITVNGGNGGLLPTVLQLNSASNGGLASGTLTLTTGRIEALNTARTLSNNVLLNTTTSVAGVFQGAQDITINGTVTGNTGSDRTLGNTLASGKKLTLNITNDASVAARFLTLGGTGDTVITGVVANGAGTGVNGLRIWGGNVTLTQANTYTGATTLRAGTLVLDFSAAGAPASNIINSGNSLVMFGGGLTLKGAGGSATNSQSVVMSPDSSLSQIVLNNNGSTGTTTLALTSTGFGARGSGTATINTDLSQGLSGNASGNAITTTAAAATLGWVTVKDAGGTGFARYDGSNVVRLTGQTTLLAASNASGTDFITAPGSTSTTGSPYLSLSAATPTYNSLTIDTSSASGANFLDLNGKTVDLVGSGGGTKAILLTGSNDFTIQGTGQLGAANSEVIVQQMGSGNLTINSAIGSAGAHLTKSGPGTLIVDGTQTRTGATTINQGTLVLNADISTAVGVMAINGGTVRLGASDRISNGNAMTMKSGGTLDLNGFNETITSLAMDAGATISGGNSSTLTLSSATPINLSAGAGTGVTSVINANLNFTNATARFDLRPNAYGAATTLEINGAISGAATSITGGGSNGGAATLRLSGTTPNTFTGSFRVEFGTNNLVEFNKTDGVDAIGTGGINMSTANTATNYKWLASNQINDSAPIIMEGGTLNLNGFNETVASLTSGITGGNTGFNNSSNGTLTLAGTTGNVLSVNNSASNVTKTLDMNLALSGSGGDISFVSGGTTNRSIQIGGTTPGARTLSLGSVVRTIDVADGAMAVDVLITSQITGTGGGFNKTGAGVLQLTAANTFSGDTKVTAGTLTLGNSQALQNSALDTTGAGAVNITGLNALTVGGLKGGTNLSSVITTGYYGGLYSLTLNPGTGVTNTYAGVISDGAELSVTKTGLGTQVLTGTNTYTGNTTINAGTLLISGSISGSTTTVNGGTLGGSGGTTGAVTVATGGTIAPGSSVGTLNTGTLTFTGGAFGLEINTSAITSDLANVSGDLNLLGGGTLSITDFSVSGTPLSIGQVFTFIDYSGVWDGGVFTGRADDSDFTLGLNTYRISYNGVDNATTAVTLEVVPEPGSAVLLLGGLAALAGFRRRRE